MSYNQRSNKSNQHNRSKYNLRKSTIQQKLEIEKRLRSLQTARTELDNQCLFLENLLSQLNITDSDEQAAINEQHRNSSDSDSSQISFDEISFRTAETSRKRDSSYARITGICAIPSRSVPLNFDRLGPFERGDAVEIKNRRDKEYKKQGVVDKRTNSFIFFSHDRAAYQRAPQNIQRIHISEYKPY